MIRPKVGDRIAVEVKTTLGNIIHYGIQYWTAEMIAQGVCKNTDSSISVYISTVK